MNRFLLFLLSGASAAVYLYWRELAGQHEKAEEKTRKKVPAKIGMHNGHEYVDLGLSVLWATCNIGAARPEDYGDYFAWGETETKERYDKDNCETWKKKIGDIGGTDRDVAHVKWGGEWRMPTNDEFDELIENCDYEWTKLNGIEGRKFTSKKNGNSIFLPAAGWCDGASLNGAGNRGYYWSPTPNENIAQDAYYLYFGNGGSYTRCRNGRSDGQSVRPVVRL